MTKFGLVLLMGILIVNCYANHYGSLPSSHFKSSIEVAGLNKNSVRVKRQALGYQSRDTTDIVVVSPGTNQAYRGNTGSRGQTVVVTVPNNNYARRYIVTPNDKTSMNH